MNGAKAEPVEKSSKLPNSNKTIINGIIQYNLRVLINCQNSSKNDFIASILG